VERKKTALCLSGIVGGTKGPDGAGDMVDVDIISNQYKKHIIDINDVDVFIHSWSVDAGNKLIECYNPTSYLFEPQIDFNNINVKKHGSSRTANNNFYSRFYSMKQSVNLKKQHEENNNFEYDMVMISRLDLLWFTDVNFENYDESYFYVSNWNHNGGGKLGPYDKSINSGSGFLDFWFMSNSSDMNRFGFLYNSLLDESKFTKLAQPAGNGTHRLSGHVVTQRFSNMLKLNVKKTMFRGHDHEVFRRYNKHCGEDIFK
tara:strand:- start:12 stop:788 length:777 start_codon:yes stop_codon:yes gene_type:complete